MRQRSVFILILILMAGCGNKVKQQNPAFRDSVKFAPGTFGFDLAFLKKHKEIIILGEDTASARVLIVADFQGRVMTTTAGGEKGNSYGWINYSLIHEGLKQSHINPVGGEDRFWIGPEGGQYGVFFKKGSPFDFASWQTPALIDTEPFSLLSATPLEARFGKSGSVTNYQGFIFNFEIRREVRLLGNTEIENEFGVTTRGLRCVAFESRNSVTNTGAADWKKKNGLISIWILGMFTPSDKTTIVIPYEKGNESKITDDYFGPITSDRKSKSGGLFMLKGDGRSRGKVGMAPSIARQMAGSYDAGKHVLTLVKFDVEKKEDYVNSKWEIQKEPYHGDVVNAYNDGPLANGSQLGPFYELESSSPAEELKKGQKLTHRHITLHLEGPESLLDSAARKTLGVSLREITNAFDKK